jgi:predicted MPP superfamily phosphohydrolase
MGETIFQRDVQGRPGRRLSFLGAGVVVAIGCVLLLGFLSSKSIWVERYEIRSPRVPSAFDGFRVLQISDLHSQRFGSSESDLIRRIRDQHPDVIAITGDLVDIEEWDTEQIRSLVHGLSQSAPVFYVTGNHEIEQGGEAELERLFQLLAGEGVRALRCQGYAIDRGSQSIFIAGIDDPDLYGEGLLNASQRLPKWGKALSHLRDSFPGGRFVVLLSHRAERMPEYAEAGFDLVLAGHTHGAIRLPLLGALYASNQGWLPRYSAGEYSNATTTMIVSRGLGGNPFLRLFNGPQLVLVVLRKAP